MLRGVVLVVVLFLLLELTWASSSSNNPNPYPSPSTNSKPPRRYGRPAIMDKFLISWLPGRELSANDWHPFFVHQQQKAQDEFPPSPLLDTPEVQNWMKPPLFREYSDNSFKQSWVDCMPVNCVNGPCDSNHENGSGYNQPPCCASVLFEMLKGLRDFMTEREIPFTIAHGTLLGSIRNQDVIPWTADNDLTVPYWVLDALLRNEKLNQELMVRGFSVFRAQNAANVELGRICVNNNHPTIQAKKNVEFYERQFWAARDGYAYRERYPYTDVYGGYVINPDLVETGNFFPTPLHSMFPLSTCTIRGEGFPCPHKPQTVLTNYFGADYLTPQRDNVSDRKF